MSQALLLTGGTVLTMDGSDFCGNVLLRDGKVAALGPNVQCAEAAVLNVAGQYVMPGIVDAHSHIGLVTSGTRERDHNELTSPIVPQMRAIDAINPRDMAFEEARSGGMTTCVTGPGSMNVIGGTFAAVKTAGNTVEEMLLREKVAMKTALGENPKTFCQDNPRYPKSRMGIAALIRETLVAADNYRQRLSHAAGNPALFVPRDLSMEAMQPVLDGTMPLKIHVHRADDIMTAIRICDEFGVSYTLDHCTEGNLLVQELAAAEQRGCRGVIVGPMNIYKGKTEARNRTGSDLPNILYRGGVLFAICTDYFETQPELLITAAALAASEGLPQDIALAAITIRAAEITGIADRVGSIAVGKDADIAVFSGYPLDVRSKCCCTIVNGKIVYQRSQS